MHRSLLHAVVFAALSVTTVAFADGPKPGESSGAPSARGRVDELFDQAVAAFDAGHYAEAQAKFVEVWALKQTYDVAGNLGVTEVRLGLFPKAAEHLAWALDHFPLTEPPKARRGFEQELAKARAGCGALRIRVSVDGADVSVNGRKIGSAPFPAEVFVDAGAVVVDASLAGYVSAHQTLTVAKGGETDVSLALAPERRTPNLGIVISGSAVAVVGIGAGIGLLVAAAGKANDANSIITQGKAVGVSCTIPPQSGTCTELRNANSTSDTLHNAGVPVLVIGAAAAAATLTYALWPRRGPERSGLVKMTPLLGTNGGGLLMSGRF
jgi:hypothetical protein